MRLSTEKPFPHREPGYPRECLYCFPRLEFFDSSELARHLRSIHATKEGGSYVCRYGENNVCQKLPLEGVSDVDYEAHIRRFHTQNAVSTNQQLSRTDSMASVSTTKSFTLSSFTQSLSAVLSDPGRSRSEVSSFFIRHWGDSFVPPPSIAQSRLIPPVTSQQFTAYIRNTAKIYKKYRAARRQLQRLQSSGEEQRGHNDTADLPMVLMDSRFSLTDPRTFQAIFTIPPSPETDPLSLTPSGKSLAAATPDEVDGTLLPGSFRDYLSLHNRLEILHDVVDSRLSAKLVNKKESFWTVVHSYGGLHQELSDAIQNVAKVRTNFKRVSTLICGRTAKIMQLYEKRERKRQLLAKLHDIVCLRDAQPMVQMMLNQSDYPRAIECIETSQNVLAGDMSGVYCFRHLGPQLQELYDVIGKIMHEDFVSLIQKELGAKQEAGAAISNEGELSSVIMGLIQMRKYSFVNVIREEIGEAVKNCMRMVVKHTIVNSGLNLSDFDPTLVQLGDPVRKMRHDQFILTIEAVTTSLFQFCQKLQALQDMMLELCDRAEKEKSNGGEAKAITPEPQVTETANNGEGEGTSAAVEQGQGGLHFVASSSSLNGNSGGEQGLGQNDNASGGGRDKETTEAKDLRTASLNPTADVVSLIAVEIHSHTQLRKSIGLIAEYGNWCAQSRLTRLLFARFREPSVMEQMSQSEVVEMLLKVRNYQRQCVEQGWHKMQPSSTGLLTNCLQRLTNSKLRL